MVKKSKAVIIFIFLAGIISLSGIIASSTTYAQTTTNPSTESSPFEIMPISNHSEKDLLSSISRSLLDNVTTVSNWKELSAALENSEVSYIVFKNDISDAPSGQIITLGRSNNSKLRNLTIDGDGYKINLKNSYFQFYSQTIPKNTSYSIKFQNIDIYQQASYGFINGNNITTSNNNSNAGSLTYFFDNTNYTGGKMVAANYSNVEFSGNITANIVARYQYEGSSYTVNQQQVVEAANITFADYTTFEAENNFYGLFNLNNRGDFNVGNHANLTLTSNSSGDVINPNNFIVGENSTIVVHSNGNNQTVINLSNSRSSNPAITVGEKSKLLININGRVGSTTNAAIYTGTKSNSSFELKNFAECKINLSGGTNSYASIVNMRGSSSGLTINSGAKLDVESTNTGSGEGFNAHFFQFGDRYRLNVLSSGQLTAKIANSPTASEGMVFGSNSALFVENDAILDIELGMTDASSYVLNFGNNSNISVKSAKLFNLEFLTSRLTSNGYLIRLPQANQGILFENQDITATQNSRGNSYASDKYGDLKWLNIAKLYIPSNSAASTGLTVAQNSLSHASTEINTINDRVASSILCNFFLANYQKLTLEKSADNDQEHTVDVTNWSELNDAVLNQSVTKINVMSDIVNNETNSNNVDRLIPKKGILINGNNHYIDFRGVGFYNNDSIAANVTMGLDIQNLKMYGQNFYGPFKYSGLTSARSNTRRDYGYGYLRYSDSSYEGAQLTASFTYDIVFAGTFKNSSLSAYQSPVDQVFYPTQGRPQVNVEATNITFEPDSHYDGSAEDAGVFRLGTGGGITLGANSVVNIKTIDKNGVVGEYGNAVLSLDGGLFCNNNSSLNIWTRSNQPQSAINIRSTQGSLLLNKSSNLNINLNDDFSSSSRSTTTPVINITSSSLKVSEFAALNISGNIERSGSSRTSTVGVITQSGNSSLTVDEYGSLNIELQGDSQNLSVLKAASSGKINFNSAKKINLDVTKIPSTDDRNRSTNVNLIEMSGYLNASYHKISAWNTEADEQPNYIWDPVYSVTAQYNGVNVTNNVTSKSNQQSIITDLKSNFKTQNFSHLLFEGYPDILINIDYLTNDKSLKSSYTIKGVTEPNALIVFSGDKAIPKATLTSYDVTDKVTKYHVTADDKGYFEFKLPERNYFTAGNTIKATAFSNLSGKSVETSQKVLTRDELPKDSDFISLESVPNIEFGNHEITGQTKLLTSLDNQKIIINGLKSRYADWKLNFKISPLKTIDGNNLPAQYWFGEKLLEPNSEETIYTNTSIEVKQYIVNFNPNDGLKLNVDLSKTNAEHYSGQATWSIVIGP